MKYKHLFGPVPSRRLGISLGVDLVPHKVCSQDCIYCEVGKTTNLTITRREYVSTTEVIGELEDFLASKPELDYITFSGAGEPTLNISLGQIVRFIKENYPGYKLALITNSNLLYQAEVQEEIEDIDLLLPSLDAASNKVFQKLNKPHKEINIDKMIEGLCQIRKKSSAKIFLEIFFAPGYNDTHEEISRLIKACRKINPHRIQLNTLDRPGVDASLQPLSQQRLAEICDQFQPLPAEIIAKAAVRKKTKSYNKNIAESIVETVSRRPCTDQDLCQILGIHINELNKYLATLLQEKKIIKRQATRGTFFQTPVSSH